MSIYFFIQELLGWYRYCSMRTCSFLLCSYSSGSSSWSLRAPLETLTCLSLLGWIFIFFLAFLILLWISSNQILVFGRFYGAHHHQFILFLCERFREICKFRHLPGLSCQLGGMEGRNKHWIVRAKLLEYGQNQLLLLLFDSTLF